MVTFGPIQGDDSQVTPERSRIQDLYHRLRIVPQPRPEDFHCVHFSSCQNTAQHTLMTGSWAYIGTQYGQALINGKTTKILFVAMDRGGKSAANKETFSDAQYVFRQSAETPQNPHMRGVHLLLSKLVDEKDPTIFSRQYALTNAVKCAQHTGMMNSQRTPQMADNCAGWLFEEIATLSPDLIITQGRYPAHTLKYSASFSSKRLVATFRGEPRGLSEVFQVPDLNCVLLTTPHPARLKGLSYRLREVPAFLHNGIQKAITALSLSRTAASHA